MPAPESHGDPPSPRPFTARIVTAPRAFDAEIGRETAAGLGGVFGASGPAQDLARGVAGSSPFLARLMRRHADWLSEAASSPPEAALSALLADPFPEDRRPLMAALRERRARAVLLIALADLGGVFTLEETTAALSRLAERAVDAALERLLAEEARRGTLPSPAAPLRDCGYAVIGMGKLGASALNFSSDIDLICLFDQDRFEPGQEQTVRMGLIRATRGLVEMLSAPTGEGYVFRTDLRLRPNPSTTPVCLSMAAAERYYEAEGRTWERAAHIKARAVAGDRAAGAAYLERLSPFVWRRSLDFYAIEDIESLLVQISAADARRREGPGAVPGLDIKRAPGGIRQIEFFAQTRQLILGGRNPSLRMRATPEALGALAAAGAVPAEAAAHLSEAYRAHRNLEHRLQMLEDAQTHTVPTNPEARDRVAALAGYDDSAALERAVAERHERVGETVRRLVEGAARPSQRTPAATPRPDAMAKALADAGVARAEDAAARFARWRSGGIAAMRSERARRLFATLEPQLITGLARAASPDEALTALERFLSGLPAGVQVFSLLAANPAWLELLLELIAAAPRLALHLGREPQALDALLAHDFFEPMPSVAEQSRALSSMLSTCQDYERCLDMVRIFAREQRFRAGVQVLRGLAAPEEAGRAFSAIAEAALETLMPLTVSSFAARHGPPPGRGMAVIALGKLGTREMTEGSDLDLVTLYDAAGAETSDGPHPLPVQAYYPRLMKALLAALTAPTAEGALYEVDMRLRPSGRQGPVAVSLEGFQRYHASEAWVWEHLALTRSRLVTLVPGTDAPDGGAGFAAEVTAALDRALARRRGDPAVPREADEMRARLLTAHAKDRDQPWALKHVAGGLMEIEFLAQTGALWTGLPRATSARALLPALGEVGWITPADAASLVETLTLLQRLQHVERVALDDAMPPERFGPGLETALARAVDAPDFDRVTSLLADHEAAAAAIVSNRFEALAGEVEGDASGL
ncbi:MAG: bifunctional [glutamine synthetase] adenylyltransferase/[glutamine synthetase]-adenylyl-L-tyrosine phosphorylase [Pseudomonadota bacterium]